MKVRITGIGKRAKTAPIANAEDAERVVSKAIRKHAETVDGSVGHGTSTVGTWDIYTNDSVISGTWEIVDS